MNRSYPLSVIEKLINNAAAAGYQLIQVSDGVSGIGHMLLIAPAPGFYHFEIKEQALNYWSSYHSLRRFTKISKRIEGLISAPEAAPV